MLLRNSVALASQITTKFENAELFVDEKLNREITLAISQIYNASSGYYDRDTIAEFSQAILDENLENVFEKGRTWQRLIPGIYAESKILNSSLFAYSKFVELFLQRVIENPRRRILKSLIYVYFNFFPYADGAKSNSRPNFDQLCIAIKQLAAQLSDETLNVYKNAIKNYNLFDQGCELNATAEALIISGGKNLDAQIIAKELGASIESPPTDFIKGLFESLCIQVSSFSADSLGLAQSLLNIYQTLWPAGASGCSFQINKSLLKSSIKTFRDSQGKAKPDAIENFIQKIIQIFGDPRLKGANDVWLDCHDEALTIKRYLSRQSLEDFFKIIQETAKDEHWRERQKFWQTYHDKDLIDEVWVILGAEAKAVADNFFNREFNAAVLSQAQPNQSVLLMRFRSRAYELTVAEWSHDGACHIWQDSDTDAPKLYEMRYKATELRQARHQEKWIAHMGPPSLWQHKIATKLKELGSIAISNEVAENHQAQQQVRQQKPTYSRFRGRR